MHEFQFISKYLKPLAKSGWARGLADDAAVIDHKGKIVVTSDALVSGVHFFDDDGPENIARKALRVNLSDLAAMSASPIGYFMALMLPCGVSEEWLARFAASLGSEQEKYGLSLLGGDTTSHEGKLAIAITALGATENPAGRNGAKPGDGIYVTGSIGDSYVGLKLRRGEASAAEEAARYFAGRYILPEPRLAEGVKLAGIASAMIDISDGLLADLAHICEESGVGAEIHAADIPVSEFFSVVSGISREELFSGGDDYELLFTSPSVPPFGTRIGTIERGGKVLLDGEEPEVKGFRHGFLG